MMTPSQTRIRLAVPTLLAALSMAACSVQDATRAPSCEQGHSVLIAAQSVPSAEMLPCFMESPVGWDVDSVDIGRNGTTIHFDSDRAGHHAARFEFVETCDSMPASEQRNGQEGVERTTLTQQIEAGSRVESFRVFEGGCVAWTFEFSDNMSRSELNRLQATLILVPRSVVRDDLADSFIDRDL